MGFDTPEPVVYPHLPPLAVEDKWAWYHFDEDDEDEESGEEKEDVE
jgi:hypothetical protein